MSPRSVALVYALAAHLWREYRGPLFAAAFFLVGFVVPAVVLVIAGGQVGGP